jgi:hypothetical protein
MRRPPGPVSAPHLSSDLRDETKLRPLVVGRKRIAEHRGREPALGGDREPLERDVSARGLNPSRQVVDGLETGPLGGHQAEDHPPVAGHPNERLEAPGAGIVVLEQQTTSTDAPEDLLRDRLVAALDEPAARLVPATEVEPEGHPRTIADDPVVELEAQLDLSFARPAATGVEVPVVGVEHHRVMGSVELEIGGSHRFQLVGLLPEKLRDAGQEVLER